MVGSIKKYGPYIVLAKGFAMPHAEVEEGSIRLGMHFIRLKEPVVFGIKMQDPIEFVCCLSVIDHKSYLKAFFNLINMLRDDEYRQHLHEAKDSEEIARIINIMSIISY